MRHPPDIRPGALGMVIRTGGTASPDQLVRYTPPHGQAWSLRRLLVDTIEEYARHVGHADLIRESVDGLVGEDPRDLEA